MKIRKWKLCRHPTVDPIPIAIEPFGALEESVPLLKDSDFYVLAENLVKEHNVIRIK